MEELNFKRELLVSNPVFAGLVEFDVTQNIGGSFPVEGSPSDNWEQNVITSVKQHDWGWVVLDVSGVVKVERSVHWAV